MRSTGAHPAFTLVELLIVVAMAGVLAALLMPAFGMALSIANRTACTNNLKQLGIALRNYANHHDGCYPLEDQCGNRVYVDETGVLIDVTTGDKGVVQESDGLLSFTWWSNNGCGGRAV